MIRGATPREDAAAKRFLALTREEQALVIVRLEMRVERIERALHEERRTVERADDNPPTDPG